MESVLFSSQVIVDIKLVQNIFINTQHIMCLGATNAKMNQVQNPCHSGVHLLVNTET